MVNNVLLVVIVYFAVGLTALTVLDACTHRIRSKLSSASMETRNKLAMSGNYVGGKTSTVLILIALWLFWPIAIYGALSSLKKERKPDG